MVQLALLGTAGMLLRRYIFRRRNRIHHEAVARVLTQKLRSLAKLVRCGAFGEQSVPNPNIQEAGACRSEISEHRVDVPLAMTVDEASFSLSLRRLQAQQYPSVRPAIVRPAAMVPLVQPTDAA